jgi:pimeloyl-ACP methyl ester carboxylesterase
VVGAHLGALLEVDVRPLLPLIQVPTLVLHHRDFQLEPLAHGRYLADHIHGPGWWSCRATCRCGGASRTWC